MTEALVFSMGKYQAPIPVDRLYAPNHVWLKPDGDTYRVGFTAYSVRLLNDVYFLEWDIEPGTSVRERQEIGQIESSKAVASLYAPADGVIVEFNQSLLDDPTPINTSGYDAGWLYRLKTEAELLTPQQYVRMLEDRWEDTQRMLKGQINEP
ncbi:MAG: glycine cleavage system protein H [Planctomycetota bacterium]|nr:MAG: glycine cleavage system protein H [Planctomycetota bacterium]